MQKKQRLVKLTRKTKETDIIAELNIDGKGRSMIKTGIAFLDHMLTLFSKHGLFDLKIKAKGDLDVDMHHTNEDVGIVMGEVFKKGLGEKRGIRRFGDSFVPMDGSLARVIVDISNRGALYIHQKAGRGTEQLLNTLSIGKGEGYKFIFAEQFIRALAVNAGINMHVEILSFDKDLHHLLEAIFKAMGRAMDSATSIDTRRNDVPSTKGKL